MGEMRALFVVAEGTRYARSLKRFWSGQCPEDDPLYELLHPEDTRGECTAWGDDPHWTVLDALTTADPRAFREVVQSICGVASILSLSPREIAIWGTALVLKCNGEGFGALRYALVNATRHLIARAPLTDEEFQRAQWWIRRICGSGHPNVTMLNRLRKYYDKAGCPPLPGSRHFRLGHLMRIYKGYQTSKANASSKPEEVIAARVRLNYFLTYGEPYWYGEPFGLHTTIASGLKLQGEVDRMAMLNNLKIRIEPEIVAQLGERYQPIYLALMGEDPRKRVKVRFYDWLTETFVEEIRPKFKVIEYIPLTVTQVNK